MDKLNAVLAIRKAQDGGDAQASTDNSNNVIWHDGNPTNITEEQIADKAAELQAEYDALEWKRNRQKEYPDAIECVHALLDGGDTLTDLQAKRTAVKDKYSKG